MAAIEDEPALLILLAGLSAGVEWIKNEAMRLLAHRPVLTSTP
jgi:hypothetical protein